VLPYAIDQPISYQRITLMYGPEKSGKSLLALYLGACCADKVPVLGAHATKKMDVVYLDAEDASSANTSCGSVALGAAVPKAAD
jgi:RecA-family ATPase